MTHVRLKAIEGIVLLYPKLLTIIIRLCTNTQMPNFPTDNSYKCLCCKCILYIMHYIQPLFCLFFVYLLLEVLNERNAPGKIVEMLVVGPILEKMVLKIHSSDLFLKKKYKLSIKVSNCVCNCLKKQNSIICCPSKGPLNSINTHITYLENLH